MVDWRDRFRAGVVHLATVARRAPTRGLAVTDRDGNDEAYAWEVDSGTLRRLTDAGTAVLTAAIEPRGDAVVYLRDETGSEFGHLHRVPFEGGASIDLTPDLEPYAASLVATNGAVVAASVASTDEQHLLCVRQGETLRWPQRELVTELLLADDGSFLVVAEPIHGLVTRTIARSTADGRELGRLDRSRPGAIHDGRIAVAMARDGWLRPAIWTLGKEPAWLDVDLPGDVVPTDWSSDGSTLVLFQTYRSQGGLALYDVPTGRMTPLTTGPGAPPPWSEPFLLAETDAGVIWSDAELPWSVVRVGPGESALLLSVARRERYPGTAWSEVSFPSEDGSEVQGWLLRPSGDGPHPAILYAHGGPTSVAGPTFSAVCQAWADHGYAVLSVNYRGSTTFGEEYRERLTGDIGGVDVADMVGARQWLVDSGTARADMVILNGWSYGGYLTLHCLATRPGLWAAGIAGAPVADWVVSAEDQTAAMDAYDLALFGTDLAQGREARVKASPRTYVERIDAPVLITTPAEDSRTPLRQVQVFVDDMRAATKDVRLDVVSGGHAGIGQEQLISIMESWLEFADGIRTGTSARIGGA